MAYAVRPTGIMKNTSKTFSDPMPFVDFTKEKTTGIRGHLSSFKIANYFFPEKTFKSELFMAECFHKGVLVGCGYCER